jgi:leader peptidase (prepilin peptidase)/N-methyltransferase
MFGPFAFAIGASVGSFLNLVADRMPSGQSFLSPRSSCDFCGKQLPNTSLVPLFSYLWLRGKCRYCAAAIPARGMVVELATAVLFTLIYVKTGFGIPWIVLSAAVSLLIAIAVIDWEHKLVLNRMVLPAMVAVLVLSPFWTELGMARTFFDSSGLIASLANSLAAGSGAFLFFLAIYTAYPQGLGGGDVKLGGLIGLLVGFPGVIVALWGGIVGAGIVAIFLLALRIKGRKDELSLGSYLSIAAIVALLWGSGIVSGYHDVMDRVAGL